MLGFKKTPGYCIYRVRVKRGGRKRPAPKGVVWGKPANHGINGLKLRINLQNRAEIKAGNLCKNLRVLNSYWVTEDGNCKWYEVIMCDPQSKQIRSDPHINWIVSKKRRECRGLTSSGRKHRPSRRANWRRRQKVSLPRKRA